MPSSSRQERWHVHSEVASTNDCVHEAARDGAPEGTVHLARSQTGGRGRIGRSWWSPAGGGLWMTVLLRPRGAPERAPGLALVAGKAVRDALQPITPAPIEIHWPNDLMVRGEKLGGILAELRQQATESWIALGIGINIDHGDLERPEALRGLATSLRELGCEQTEPVLIGRAITARLWPLYDRYEDGETLETLLEGDLVDLGRRVRVEVSRGHAFEGAVEGLGDCGELLVRTADGTLRSVRSGDVSYEPPAS